MAGSWLRVAGRSSASQVSLEIDRAGEKAMADGPQGREAAAAVLVLDPQDNVVVCRRDVRAGETILVDGEMLNARSDVALGHKIARCAIRQGTPVIKYGMSIGSSTCEIRAGEWVHLHNMKSNYIPIHTRGSREGR
jgi:hypothetical protein